MMLYKLQKRDKKEVKYLNKKVDKK